MKNKNKKNKYLWIKINKKNEYIKRKTNRRI